MEINIWAVVVSAIASMVIGSIWYGTFFRKQFEEACGMDKWTAEQKIAEQKKMGMSYFIQLIASLVMFYILAMFVSDTEQMTLSGGLLTAFWAWLGFVVPTQLGSAIWGGNMKLFWLGAGNMLFTLLASGAIIGSWR